MLREVRFRIFGSKMIDSYEKIFLELNQAMRDDPMLNDLVPPEVFDQIMSAWKKNLEKRGIVKKNSFVTSKGFYSTFRDRLDHFSALGGRSGPGGSAFRPIRIDENPFIIDAPKKSSKSTAGLADKNYLDMPFQQTNDIMMGRESSLMSKMDFTTSNDKEKDRSSYIRDNRPSESMLAVKGGGNDPYLLSTFNSFSVERTAKTDPAEVLEPTKLTDSQERAKFMSSSSHHKNRTANQETVSEKPEKAGAARIEIAINFDNIDEEPSEQRDQSIPLVKLKLEGVQPSAKRPPCKIEAEAVCDDDDDLFGEDNYSEKQTPTKMEDVKTEEGLKETIKQESDGMLLNKRSDLSDIAKDEPFQDEDDEEDDEDLFDSAPEKNDSEEENPYLKLEPKKEKPPTKMSEKPKHSIKTAMDMKIEASLLRDLDKSNIKQEDGKTSIERAQAETEVIEEELNSNDDISDYNDDFDTGDNLLLGFYVKSKRKKDKRKITFRNCVLRINGQEQVISEARGEFRWAYGARERIKDY